MRTVLTASSIQRWHACAALQREQHAGLYWDEQEKHSIGWSLCSSRDLLCQDQSGQSYTVLCMFNYMHKLWENVAPGRQLQRRSQGQGDWARAMPWCAFISETGFLNYLL